MVGPEIVARTLAATAIPDKFGNTWQYHSRSDRHSKAACWGMLFDLLQTSKLLTSHVRSGEIAFGINHEMRDFKHGRKKNLDLVLCEPLKPERSRRGARTFSSLVSEFGVQLTDEEGRLLGALPVLPEAPVAAVRIALEAKACMTAHVRALPRLYDELNSSHLTVHGSSDIAVAAGFVMVNLAGEFVSSDMNRRPLSGSPPTVNIHRQPADTIRVIEKVHEIPRRTATGESGFDALSIVVLEFRNDGTSVLLHRDAPAPEPGDIYNYESSVFRAAQLYDYRFGRA